MLSLGKHFKPMFPLQTKGNSNAMEILGLKLCLEQLFEWDIKPDNFISDRHMQIRAFMRDTYGPNRKAANRNNPEIIHYLDIWHVAKSKCKSTYCFTFIHHSFHIAVIDRYVMMIAMIIECQLPYNE